MTKKAAIIFLATAGVVLLLFVATVVFKLGLPLLPLVILFIVSIILGNYFSNKEEVEKIGKNWLEDELRQTLAQLYREQKPIGRLKDTIFWEEYDLTPIDRAKELYGDYETDTRPFFIRNRTFLLTQLKQYEDLQNQFLTNFSSPMERAKYPIIQQNYDKILVEFHDAIACMSKQVAEIEQLISQAQIKKVPERHESVFAEEVKTESPETYSPPDWTNK